MSSTQLHFLSDEEGNIKSVLVPIAPWKVISSELETQHVLRSDAIRERLVEAIDRNGGMTYDDILQKLDIREGEIVVE